MSESQAIGDEPVLDSAARYHVCEPSQDEIEDHRSKRSNLVGIPSNDIVSTHSSNLYHGITASATHRHRRRRKHIPGVRKDDSSATKAHPADPSEHIMFLLGECDGEDEQPHQLFCELDELWHDPTGSGETEWREAARWIKFEEDVEESGERWSKPHVATLSLFSLFELRNCLANAVILLNLEAYTMEHISDKILNLLVSDGRVPFDQREIVLDVLLRRHVHLHERLRPKLGARSATNLPLIRSLADIGRKHSSKDVDKELTSQASLAKISNTIGMDSLDPALAAHVAAHAQANTSGHSEVVSGSLQGKFDLHFLKKIPPGSETSNILVGETTFLATAVSAFVRLKEPVLLGDMTEVPVPTRFLFIHLGTKNNALKYREIGRSMGVLMSDEIFHDVAYKAKSRSDLLAGVDEFLSAATVLPPGEWDPSIRIEPPASVPSQDSRKTTNASNGTANTSQALIAAPSVTSPEGSALEQMQASGDRLPGLCWVTHGSTPDAGAGGAGSPGSAPDTVSVEAGHIVTDEELAEHGNDPALQRTGRLFGGLMQDIKRRAPYYISDYKDSLHPQCCASFIFLYFACLTPIITFGGLLSQATGGHLGTIESILSGAVVGILYSLFSGQPLTIMGSTGPVLIFESIVYKMCSRFRWQYLSFRFWIGSWLTLFLMLAVAFDLSALVKFITRFTEESFASLIALIFIMEALKKIYAVHKVSEVDTNWSPSTMSNHSCVCSPPSNLTDAEVITSMHAKHPLKMVPLFDQNMSKLSIELGERELSDVIAMRVDWDTISQGRYSWESLRYRDLCQSLNGVWIGSDCTPFYVPDVFFFSVLLFFLTFFFAVGFKSARTSLFFPARVRAVISDFAVFIAIASATLLDFFSGIHTPKLQVPKDFAPTLGYQRRGWYVPPFKGNPWWTSLVALGPALVAVILIFMDQQITAVIVNRRENKLKKGAGYHLDLLLVAITIMVNTILGIPWFVAATVLSINHVLSLKKESETSAPGERPVYLGCREQRVTGVFIFLFIGLSVFMTPLLSLIPMPVLYGIFLFMGISSLNGVQMVQRVMLLFMPIKYQPDYSYLRHVSLRRIHLYTIIQVTCLAMLWVIKSVEAVSILFPIMVLAMCFIRKGLDFIFTQDELQWLDELMPGSKPTKRPVPRITSYADMHNKDLKPKIISVIPMEQISSSRTEPKRINITEEVSKTNIWRQLSGGNITENSNIQSSATECRFKSTLYDSPGKRKKRRSKKDTDKSVSNHAEDRNQIDSDEVKKLVVFCIDPKEQDASELNKYPQSLEISQDVSLTAPQITINPPSVQGSPDIVRRTSQH